MVDALKRENPIMASMMFADRAFLILKRVNRVLTLSLIVSSFIVSLVALYVTRSFIPIYTIPREITIPLGVAIFVVLAPMTVYYGLMAKRTLQAWVKKFNVFSYVVRFETSPLRGKTPQERLMNQLLESIPEVGEPLKELLVENPATLNDFLNVNLRGATEEETFDVCIRKEQIKGEGRTADQLRGVLRTRGLILVKRFDKKDPVNEDDLTTIRTRLLQILKGEKRIPFQRTKINRILIVSTAPFAESARKYVEDRRNRVGGKSFDLVEKDPKGYTVVSATT